MSIRSIQALFSRALVTRRIRKLASRADSASAPYRASLCARAGDLARDAGLRDEALQWYGEAIDGYLMSGRGRAAELVCERVLAAYPEVVRARYTLALIAIGHGDTALATLRVRDYTQAMRRGREEEQKVAVTALLELATVTPDPAIRGEIARGLELVGEREVAVRVREGRAAPAEITSWSRSVLTALRYPGEGDVDLVLDES